MGLRSSRVADERKEPTFEQNLKQLERIVAALENNSDGSTLSLEKSVELFEKGMKLSGKCRAQLDDASTRVDVLLAKDGSATTSMASPTTGAKMSIEDDLPF